ncbi:MAG: response regulator transcription factor [Planctomycetota bacterium]|jgi:DNA-binding response OmpR family regulator
MKVLLIEDSKRLQRSLRLGLSRSGFAVDVVGDGEEGLAYALHGKYDVIILDLRLPKMDGMTLLSRLRNEGNKVHVLILSAKDQTAERIEGLRLGADDYLTKPFDFDELVARLQALVRRKYGTKSPIQSLGPLAVDTSRRAVSCGDQEIELTKNEYAVLEYLVARRGRVVSKLELLDHLYAGAATGSENAVEVFVHQLRKKLQGNGLDELIKTRRGHGYFVN